MPKREPTAIAQVGLRIPEALRARIEKAAKATGNSMNAEIVQRLEGSFELEERLGGPQLKNLIEAIASAMKSTGQIAGDIEASGSTRPGSWLVLPYSFNQAFEAAVAILEAHRPKGEIIVPELGAGKTVGGDPEESRERHRQLLERLGTGIAQKEMREREEDK